MRVVCDNCGAVYKIANTKLTKEVNRATCKRCGHKIVIFKPGSQAAEEAAAARAMPRGVPSNDEDEERTVIKSVPELEKLAGKQGVPSIGSLTAELRAISIPGIQSVAGPAPAPPQLGPVGPEPDTHPPVPPVIPPPVAQPIVRPATAIPPSDSPKTKVYNGPQPSMSASAVSTGASVGGKSTAPPPPLVTGGRTDPTRPMPLPTTGGPVPASPTLPRNGSSNPMVSGVGPATVGSSPAPISSTIGSATAVAPVAEAASPVMGVVGLFATVGLIGLVAAIYVTGPVSALAFGMAALGICGCLCLAMLTSKGRKPERTPLALLLAFLLAALVGGLQFAASGGLDFLDKTPEPRTLKSPPISQPPAKLPAVKPAADPVEDPADGSTDGTEPRFSASEIAGLGATEDPATPVKESKRDVVTRPPPSERAPTSRTQRAPSPPVEEPTPKPRSDGPSRATVAPPSDSGASTARADGPSPFVIDTIIRNNAAIVRCLRVEEAKGVDLSGKIYLKFTIAGDGGVSKARVTTSRFAGTALDTCISRELNGLTFPPFDGSAKKITYPLIVQ